MFASLMAMAYCRPGFLHSAAVVAPIALPSAVSHSSRVDFHSSPIVVAHAAPALALAPAAHLAHYALPAATSYSSRYDVHSAPLLTVGHGYHGW